MVARMSFRIADRVLSTSVSLQAAWLSKRYLLVKSCISASGLILATKEPSSISLIFTDKSPGGFRAVSKTSQSERRSTSKVSGRAFKVS